MPHKFNTGDKVHDIDGNTYIVEGNHAVLYIDGKPMSKSYDLTKDNMSACFCYREEFESVPFKLREKDA